MKRSDLKEIIKDNIIELLREEAYSSWTKQVTEDAAPDAPAAPTTYNPAVDFTKFQAEIGVATDNVKKKFQKVFASKLVGKKITVRASKGDANQIKTDYVLKPISVNIAEINEDWKLYLVGEDKKRYFLDEKIPVKIMSAAGAPATPPPAPEKPDVSPAPSSGMPSSSPKMTPSPASQPSSGGNIVSQK